MNKRVLTVLPYHASWPEKFKSEQVLIARILPLKNVTIEHIGSTSVIGLMAKPIIDILVEVDCLSVFEKYAVAMSAIGYVTKGENGIVGRQYFQKGDENRSFHLHGFLRGDIHARRHVAYRNYLRCHPDAARQYGELKQQLVKKSANDMNCYMKGKDSFIQHHLLKAMSQ